MNNNISLIKYHIRDKQITNEDINNDILSLNNYIFFVEETNIIFERLIKTFQERINKRNYYIYKNTKIRESYNEKIRK